MISDQAVDAFVVGDCISGSEFDDDLDVCIAGYCAFGFVEKEDVVGVCEKFVICVEFGVISESDHLRTGVIQLYLSEIY